MTIPNPYLLEAEKHERYRDQLIQRRNHLDQASRAVQREYATLTHSIETAEANVTKYRALAQQQEAK